ncbi:MAG: hypothetical protein K1W34_17410 [Lachnospiraceae bacterium]
MSENKTNAVPSMDAGQQDYNKKVHRVGTITMLTILVITIIPIIYIYVFCGGFPGWGVVSATVAALVAYNSFQWILEAVLYFPMVGVPGSYICFTAGNILTMRVPCSLAAQNAVNAKNGTPKAELASVFGMVSSVVVNFFCLGIVVFFGNFLLSVMPESVKTGFNYVMPALFGALLIMMLGMFSPKKKEEKEETKAAEA